MFIISVAICESLAPAKNQIYVVVLCCVVLCCVVWVEWGCWVKTSHTFSSLSSLHPAPPQNHYDLNLNGELLLEHIDIEA